MEVWTGVVNYEKHVYPDVKLNIDTNSILSVVSNDDENEDDKIVKGTLGIDTIMDINKFSLYRKLLRITAYVLRFISNCRLQLMDRRHGPCNAKEIENSEMLWIRSCQRENYDDEYMELKGEKEHNKILPRLRQLKLFLDKNRIIRCKGRIENAPIAESAKFPILLPANVPLTTLIVREAHESILHSGVSNTISHIRQR